VRKPQVFLFDEPLSNLDASLRVQMRVELSRLHQELKTTMIYVTHDQVEAMTLGQRIVVLNGGRIEQVGTPHALYNHPANLFVAGFLGAPKMNFISATIASIGNGTVRVRTDGRAALDVACDGSAAQVGAKVTLGVRAEHLEVRASGANLVEVELRHVEYLGDQSVAYSAMAGSSQLVAARCAPHAALAAGGRLTLHLPPAHCHLFDATGKAFARTI
jgi:multiple sugar transport system ATP-binding protein